MFKNSLAIIAAVLITTLPLHTISAAGHTYPKPNGAQETKRHSSNVVHIKFHETPNVTLSQDKFVSQTGKDIGNINTVIDSKAKSKSRLFTASSDDIKQKRAQIKAASNVTTPDLNSYFRITLHDGEDINSVVKTLKSNPAIAEAYAEPIAAPAPTPNYSSLQTYFSSAPTGAGVTNSSNYPGALGDRVKIADLEYGWNANHEDISDSRQAGSLIANGTPVDPFNDPNHGTAVIGMLNGDRNGYGIDGIVPNAQLHMVNTYNMERGWDIANSIYTAQNNLSAGDVMLIEQQAYGPEGRGYMPVEWIPAVYDAIRTATASGIIVVEAAANGYENLDDPIFGTSFPQGKADSGAIIVGAGAACNSTTQHSRLGFSNYGQRVNVQGYGECVTTSGYGGLNNEAGYNGWYTSGFSGTSSASAMVAGVAGSVSSAYEAQSGYSMSPVQLRSLLASTGTAQYTGINPGNIGSLPNIDAAIKSFTDTTAPTTPLNLTATQSRNAPVNLKWTASTDNSGSVMYRVYRNNELISTTSNPYYVDSSTARSTSYTYKVQATDARGNLSAYSNTATIKTRR